MARRLARLIKNYQNMLNIKVHYENDGSVARYTLPGFVYDDFDRTGNLSIWKIIRHIGMNRLLFFDSSFSPWAWKDGKPVVGGLVAQQFTINKEMYSKQSLCRPIEYQVALGYVGSSVFTFGCDLKDSDSGHMLVTGTQFAVQFDQKTGRSAPLDPDIRETAKKYAALKDKPALPASPARPTDSKLYKLVITVVPSDLGQDYHVHHANYVRFCMDCAAEASMAKLYGSFIEDICWYHVRDLVIQYKGQARGGDKVTVVSWEDVIDPTQLHFEIEKDSKVIVTCSISFYLNTESKL